MERANDSATVRKSDRKRRGYCIGKKHSLEEPALLDLSHNRIEHDGAVGLAGNTAWSELEKLDLQHNLFDDESSVALGRNSSWKKLEKVLVVEGNSGVSSPRKLLFALNSKISNEFDRELEKIKESDTELLINEKEAQFKIELKQYLTDYLREEFGATTLSYSGIPDINEELHAVWSPNLEVLN